MADMSASSNDDILGPPPMPDDESQGFLSKIFKKKDKPEEQKQDIKDKEKLLRELSEEIDKKRKELVKKEEELINK